MTEDWQTCVKRGKTLARSISRASWDLGDLALSMFPPGERTGPADDIRTIGDFADAIDVSVGTITNLRYVSRQWPAEKRVTGVSWSTHRALAAHDDRFEVIHEGMRRSDATALLDKVRASAPVAEPTFNPSQAVEYATSEARSTLAFVTDKRRKLDSDTRAHILGAAVELLGVVDALIVHLEAPAQAEAPPERRTRRWPLLKAA